MADHVEPGVNTGEHYVEAGGSTVDDTAVDDTAVDDTAFLRHDSWVGEPRGPWPKPLIAAVIGLAFLVSFCAYDSLGGDEATSSDGDSETDGSGSEDSSEASSPSPANRSTLPVAPAAPSADGSSSPATDESSEPEPQLERLPLPDDYVPGVGFTNSAGTYFSTFGAPPEAVAWMESPQLLFNQPLPADTPTVPNSTDIAAKVEEIVRGERLYDYGSGFEEGANAPYMVLVDSETEQFTEVVFNPGACGSDTWWSWTSENFEPYLNGAYGAQGKTGIPLPADFAMNGNDGDFHVMVYDWRSDVMIELWHAMPTNLTGRPGIEVCWGGVTKDFAGSSRGVYPFPVGVDAAGLSAAGLTVTLEDVRRGEIRHAIGVSSEIVINNGGDDSFSYPANRNDGQCSDDPQSDYSRRVTEAMEGASDCLYEGQYLRLPADYDVDAISHPFARMIAKAGRDYGFVVHDVAGCFCIQSESGRAVTENGLSPADPWAAVYDGAEEWEILWQIDWRALEILPPDWNRPADHRIACAVPPNADPINFPMSDNPRCQVPGDPYLPG